MDCLKQHEETHPRREERQIDVDYKPARERTITTKIKSFGNINQRACRTSSPEQSRYPRGAANIGGNIDQLILSVQEQILANEETVKDIAGMYEKLLEREVKLKACLDQLIEIRETSRNVE